MKSNQQRTEVMQLQDLALWAQTQKTNGIHWDKWRKKEKKTRKGKTVPNLT